MSIGTVASRAARPTRAPRQRGGAGREGGRASPRANRAGLGVGPLERFQKVLAAQPLPLPPASMARRAHQAPRPPRAA